MPTAGMPTAEELIARARGLVPLIRENAARGARERRVVPEVVEAIRRAGLFKIMQPRRWGGFEMDPSVFADVQFVLAAADMSTGWVFGVMGVHNFQMGLFEDRAAEDVWGRDPDALICSSFQAGANAVPTEGGYRFSGRWHFASGCDHADWMFLGGRADTDFLTCLVPRSEFRIVDNWHTPGLKGTGSKDVVVEDIVVPYHRVHASSDGYRCDSPGNRVNTGWLYRMPFHQVFIRGITNASIGCLQGMVDEFRDYGAKRVSVVAGPTALDPDARRAMGEAVATVHELTCVLRSNFAELRAYAERGEVPPFDKRLLWKLSAASATDRCVEAARSIFENTGGSGLFEDASPFGRMYTDLVAAKQHAAAQNHLTARSLGTLELGGVVENEFYL